MCEYFVVLRICIHYCLPKPKWTALFFVKTAPFCGLLETVATTLQLPPTRSGVWLCQNARKTTFLKTHSQTASAFSTLHTKLWLYLPDLDKFLKFCVHFSTQIFPNFDPSKIGNSFPSALDAFLGILHLNKKVKNINSKYVLYNYLLALMKMFNNHAGLQSKIKQNLLIIFQVYLEESFKIKRL